MTSPGPPLSRLPRGKASRKLFETRSSKKSGTRLSASIKEFRQPASRRRNHPRRPDQAISAARTLHAPLGPAAALVSTVVVSAFVMVVAHAAVVSIALSHSRRTEAGIKSQTAHL